MSLNKLTRAKFHLHFFKAITKLTLNVMKNMLNN